MKRIDEDLLEVFRHRPCELCGAFMSKRITGDDSD